MVRTSLSSQCPSSHDCPTNDSSFPQPAPSSPCGLQIPHPPCWLRRKCVLRKQAHPKMLERLLTRTLVWSPPASTKDEQSRRAWKSLSTSKNSTFNAALCLSVYFVCANDEQPASTSARLSGTFPHILHMVLI